MPRRRFTDSAGYTRHCWECKHAKEWRKGLWNTNIATCEVTGKPVDKYESPNNPSLRTPDGCDYDY